MILEHASARSLREHAPLIAAMVVERQYRDTPELERRFGAEGRRRCAEDTAYHLQYLAEAIDAGDDALFLDYIAWAKAMLAARHVGEEDLVRNLRLIRDAIREATLAASPDAERIIGLACDKITSMPSTIETDPAGTPYEHVAREYLQAVLSLDRGAASRVAEAAIEDGISLADLYVHVLQPCQVAIGALWQANKITVAHEHFATAVTQAIMASLYEKVLSGQPRRGVVVVATVEGEQHEVGARMLADLLEMDGWRTVYVGANTPARDLIKLIDDVRPRALALSVTTPFHLLALRELIRGVRASATGAELAIFAGGRPFAASPGLAESVGADGTAPDAKAAVEAMRRLAAA